MELARLEPVEGKSKEQVKQDKHRDWRMRRFPTMLPSPCGRNFRQRQPMTVFISWLMRRSWRWGGRTFVEHPLQAVLNRRRRFA